MPDHKVSTESTPKLKEKPFIAIFSGATFQGEKTFKPFNEYQKFIKEVSPKDEKGRPNVQNFKVEFKQL